MVLKIKSIPSFEREDHVESKYIIKNDFDFFKKSKLIFDDIFGFNMIIFFKLLNSFYF